MRNSGYPTARRDGLVLRELPDELLVYDTETHEAHCLNETAAFVWKQCDGTASVAEIGDRLRATFGAEIDDEVVWHSLEDLWKRQLLEGEAAPAREGSMSRSTVLKRAAVVAAVSVPVVTSIVAPTAAHAASFIPCGSPCTQGGTPCASPCTCVNGTCASPGR
jgi:coenzyme PQQ synthesis protein D (PqqD)